MSCVKVRYDGDPAVRWEMAKKTRDVKGKLFKKSTLFAGTHERPKVG